ncbi:phage scaffolding protein [Anaerotignum sp. MB30-C6]|uniref:phage scaffolding protein n=1 Tax=Anaerotignum sp. MB30-C6 TaxID=3070814 RepID=UPI0027DD2657|nr:hypothetical protein [Anaerotignum sp. MB30-C6]WMI81838.1 hypothetical protein RBQ60_03675 [Anaerotignum sp. MB30-C6]WMI81938.1 hypothetical protein RBQ60_04190 [Anaerotignum sp. MB30-C6]
MEWLKEILKGLENSEDLEKKITGGIGKNFVAREDFNTLNTTKKKLEGDIVSLKADLENGNDFKKKFEDLEKKIADEKAEADRKAKEDAEEADFQNRFNGVVGENKWRDELTGKAVYGEFKAALKDEGNKGKGDSEILEALTKDKDYYVNPNKPKDMTPMGRTDFSKVTREQFGRMSYKERVSLFNENKELYESLSTE